MSVFKKAATLLPGLLAGLGLHAAPMAADTDGHEPPLAIHSDTRWTIKDSPYLLPCHAPVVVAAGATLSIDAGVTVALPSRKDCGTGPGLVVEGTLAAGTPGAPAVFTSLVGDAPAGNKDYESAIEFRPGSTGTVVINARFGRISYDADTEVAVDRNGSAIQLELGSLRARVSAVARPVPVDPPAGGLPSQQGFANIAAVRPTAAPAPFWFPADTMSGEVGFGLAPAHNEIDLNRCHSGPGSCNAYATWRLRTNLTLHPVGRGPLSRLYPFLAVDTFFGDNHPGSSYSLNATPTMLEHTVGLRIELPKGFWVSGETHSNHWFGRYAGVLGPADLGPNGPFGQYSLISVGHRYQWSPRLWLTGLGR